eukprot:scaffold1261_cov49-Phaeocystis_antarctica.AAC.3
MRGVWHECEAAGRAAGRLRTRPRGGPDRVTWRSLPETIIATGEGDASGISRCHPGSPAGASVDLAWVRIVRFGGIWVCGHGAEHSVGDFKHALEVAGAEAGAEAEGREIEGGGIGVFPEVGQVT